MKSFEKHATLGLLAVSSLSAHALVAGTAATNTGNCYPFGCASFGSEYQQVYGASEFSGTTPISSLTFYNTQFDSGNYDANFRNYSLYLSTTSAAVDGLSSGGASNIGGDETLVYSGTLTGVGTFGGSMDILLDTIFTYDSSAGNLLLRVSGTGVSGNGSNLFFDMADSPSDALSRYFRNGLTDTRALVTGFNEATNSVTVSEPASFALLGLGLAGMGLVRGKRKTS